MVGLGWIVFFVCVFGIWAFESYLHHKERMKKLELGIVEEEED